MPNHVHMIAVPETKDGAKPTDAAPGASIFVRDGVGIYGREDFHL
jgi:hypothetical protein